MGKQGKRNTSKGTQGATTGTQGGVQATATPGAGVQGNQAVNPQVIAKVKAGVTFRGARAAWYEVLMQHEGKAVKDFYAATASTPPSTPKSGVVEKPSGWLAFFVRSGIAQLQ